MLEIFQQKLEPFSQILDKLLYPNQGTCRYDVMTHFLTYFDKFANSLTKEFDLSPIISKSGIDSTYLLDKFIMKDGTVSKETDFNKLMQSYALEMNDDIIGYFREVGGKIAARRDYVRTLVSVDGIDRYEELFGDVL